MPTSARTRTSAPRTITANYDGFTKHRTTIGSGVRIGVDTTLVAPVEIGDDAYTAAGSVISKDLPAGALGVARAHQRNVEGYAERRRERAAAEREEHESTPSRRRPLEHLICHSRPTQLVNSRVG